MLGEDLAAVSVVLVGVESRQDSSLFEPARAGSKVGMAGLLRLARAMARLPEKSRR